MPLAQRIQYGLALARRHWSWIVVATLLLTLLGTVGYALMRRPHVAIVDTAAVVETPTTSTGPIRWPALPSSLPTNWLASLQRRHGLPDAPSSTDAQALQKLHAALADDPWVASVASVRADATGQVVVDLTFRTPVAWIETNQPRADRLLIDAAGHALATDKPAESGPQFYVRGATKPPRALGQLWGDAEVEGAAAAIGRYGAEWTKFGLSTVRLGADPLQSDLRLETVKGTQVIWEDLHAALQSKGSTPADRLEWLRRYVTEWDSLDGPDGPYVLDVRPADGMRRQVRLRPEARD